MQREALRVCECIHKQIPALLLFKAVIDIAFEVFNRYVYTLITLHGEQIHPIHSVTAKVTGLREQIAYFFPLF